MKSSKKRIIINHRAEEVYKIVLDIEKYPEFIPWCKEIFINTKNNNEIIADMIVQYKNFKSQKFTSQVVFDSKNLSICTKYINGPLKDLETKWIFKNFKNKKTEVVFFVKFQFINFFHQKIAEIFFNLIENKMINSFKIRADKILN